MKEKLIVPGTPVASEIINLVPQVQEWVDGKKMLEEMGQRCREDFDADDASREVWKANVARSVKLFSNFLDRKTEPWPNASNINLPMLAIASLQFQARAFDALIPSKGVVQTLATGDEDVRKAERVRKYMDFELLYAMDSFEEGMDRSLIQLPLEGSVFRKTFYDPVQNQNVSDYISAQDIVLQYNTRTTIEEAPRKSHLLYYYPNDIAVRVHKGVFIPAAGALGPGTMSPPLDTSIRDAADKIMGVKNQNQWYDQPRTFIEQHRWWDLDGDGLEEPVVITVDYESQMVVRITDRRYYDWQGIMRTLEYFTHYYLIPNPEGFYGLGFGILLSGLNEAANEIVNEVIDAGHLANMQGGFISRRSGIKRGSLLFKRGEFKEVETYVDDLKKAIYSFDFKGPNQTLYAVLGLLFEYSKLVSSVSETMTGQLPASDTPATTVMALIEEGRKVFSTIHKRIHKSFKRELHKLFRLNSIFLDEQRYFMVLGDNRQPMIGPDGRPVQEQIGRSDFSNNIDVIPVSDPNIVSRAEKILKAQQTYEITLTSPITNSNPDAIFKAQRRLYEALEVSNIDELLQPPGPPPDISPEEENAGIIQQKPATALPHQDHQYHMSTHEDLVNGPFAEELTPEAKKLLDQHIQQHIAFMYLQSKQREGGGMSGTA